MTDQNEMPVEYSAVYVTFRPDLIADKTLLIAIFVVRDGNVQASKRLEGWQSLLEPGSADCDLISEIVDEFEVQLTSDPKVLDRATEWSTSVEVSTTKFSYQGTPTGLIDELIRVYRG